MTTVRVQARYNMHKCESHASSALLYVDQAGFIVDLPVDLCLARLTSFALIIHATRRLRNIATGIDVLRTVEHFDLTRLLRGKRIDLPVTSSFIFVIVLCLSCD